MPPAAPPNTPTQVDPTEFWTDASKYTDPSRVSALNDIYKQELGRTSESVGKYDELYFADDPTLAAARNYLHGKKEAAQWRNPTPGSAEAAVNQDTMPNPIDIYNKALDQLGIGDARTRVQGLRNQLASTENLLANLEGDITERTQNSLVTEAQRRRMLASEQNPLTKQLETLGNTYEAAYGDYGDILGEAGQQTEFTMEGEMLQRQALMDRLQNAIDRSTRKEDKRRWQAEYNRLKKQQELDQKNWERQFGEQKRQFNLEDDRLKANAGGSGGGGSGGGYGSSYTPASGAGGYGNLDRKSTRLNSS